MEGLKPCPFCGEKPLLETDVRWPDNSRNAVTAYFVICKNYNCPIYHADNTWYKTGEKAREEWNKRAT